ncbi:hypothetical protein ACOTWN_11135, partial [Aliarcobacter butzleri]
ELGRNGKESSLNAAIHTRNLNSKTIKGIYAYLKDLNNPSKKCKKGNRPLSTLFNKTTFINTFQRIKK